MSFTVDILYLTKCNTFHTNGDIIGLFGFFSGEQCAMFNNNTFNIADLEPNVQWLPKYGGCEYMILKIIATGNNLFPNPPLHFYPNIKEKLVTYYKTCR